MKPTLTFNCPEKWENMKIGVISRYCESCSREVQDFTKMSREEILHYLWTNRDTKVCGRIMKSQLDYHHEEILITVESFLEKNKNSNLAFYLLAASALIMLGCSDDKAKTSREQILKQPRTMFTITASDTVEVNTFVPPVVASEGMNCTPQNISSYGPLVNLVTLRGSDWNEHATLGYVVMEPIGDVLTNGDGDNIRSIVSIMPEFKGGYDSLQYYITQNLKYPEWEKENRLAGIVFVSFIIDKDGDVKDPKIKRTVPNAKNFDSEVLRVVNAMPAWIPGSDFGGPTAVEFTLPIRFRI